MGAPFHSLNKTHSNAVWATEATLGELPMPQYSGSKKWSSLNGDKKEPDFCCNRIYKFVPRLEKCTNVLGDHVDK
jgi:hypothetical protein